MKSYLTVLAAPTLAILAAGTGCLLLAEDGATRDLKVTTTERIDFPSGGLLRMQHSTGELRVEGWDEPVMELTVTKSPPLRYDGRWNERAIHTKEVRETRVTAERHGDEVVVTTVPPRRRGFPPPSLLRGSPGVELAYVIKVPRTARLAIEHDSGEVHIEGLAGDIRSTVGRGEITLRLPEEQYAIDARSGFGGVVSEFPGVERRRSWLFGHRFVPEGPAAGQKLYLRVGFGDIVIQKIQKPATRKPAAAG